MLRGTKIKLNNSKPTKTVLNMNIHNRFDIEVLDSTTGEVKQKAQALNIICDNLWGQLCSWQAYAKYIYFGTGSGSPSTSDTNLFSQLGCKEATVVSGGRNIDYVSGIFSIQRSIQILENEHVGATITEVGIGYSNSNGSLCTHAMLMDMNGNPTSIVKKNNDIINVYSTVYVHFNPYGYDNGSITIYSGTNGKSILDFLAGSNAAVQNSSYGTRTFYCSGGGMSVIQDTSFTSASPIVTHSGDVSTKTLKLTMERIGASSGNISGINAIVFGQYAYSYGTHYTSNSGLCIRPGGTWLPYSSIKSEALGTGDGSTIKYNLDFPFAKNVKVYVDGVQTTDFTVRYGIINTSEFVKHFEELREGSTTTNFIHNYSTTNKFTNCVLYNPMYEIGVKSLTISGTPNSNFTLKVSNDLTVWYTISDPSNIQSVYQHYKFWKIESTKELYYSYINAEPLVDASSCIFFSNPPKSGSVITADYNSISIAKDSNHVFDLEVTFKLGEYVE